MPRGPRLERSHIRRIWLHLVFGAMHEVIGKDGREQRDEGWRDQEEGDPRKQSGRARRTRVENNTTWEVRREE